jgi:hypothetical protein
MSDFNPLGGNPKTALIQWVPASGLFTTFMPFPASTNSTQEVAYNEGGYGLGGYDTQSLPAVNTPRTNWLPAVRR